MAIGTTAAILGSAVIGAGASAIASGNNSKAIKQSTQAAQDSNAQSIALQRDIYGQNKATLSPFVNRGNAAGNALNDLLGLGGSQPQVQPNALSQFSGYNPQAINDVRGQTRGAGLPYGIGDNYVTTGQFSNGAFNANPQVMQQNPGFTSQTPQQAQTSAFDNFRNSTAYDFTFNEGLDAVSSAYAGSGMFQSGAAMRGISDYGQNMALQNALPFYTSLLSQQQGTGLQAAGAQAGVGVNYANSVGALNQANADAISAGAVARANNSNALIGALGNIGGSALGYYGGR